MRERRDTCLASIEEFGGLEGLIDSPDKYNVRLSSGVYNLFCQKYKELTVTK